MCTLLQQFGGLDSVWMPMVATSDTYIESKIQGHLSYEFCFFMSKCVYIFFGHSVVAQSNGGHWPFLWTGMWHFFNQRTCVGRNPGTHWTGGWFGSRGGLYFSLKRNTSFFHRDFGGWCDHSLYWAIPAPNKIVVTVKVVWTGKWLPIETVSSSIRLWSPAALWKL